jgi:hypothetical protein
VPVSAAAAVLDQSLKLSFDGTASISAPGLTLPHAGWVSEGAAIPVLQGTSTAGISISPHSLKMIVVLTREMTETSNSEQIMRQIMLENLAPTLDSALFSSAAAVAGLSPAGILAGVAPITPAVAGANAMVTDLSALAAALGPVSGGSPMVIVANPAEASMIKLVAVDPPPVYACSAVPAKTVIALVPSSIVSAMSTPTISVSNEITLHMETVPAELVSTPGTIAAPQRSLFQTDSLALRFTIEASWARRGNGVAYVQNVNW